MTAAQHALIAHERISHALECLADDDRANAIILLGHAEHEARAAAEAIQREAREHLAREAAAASLHALTLDDVADYQRRLRGPALQS